MHYTIKDQKFYHPMGAFLYAAHNCPHDHVYFDIDLPAFEQIDWTVYPEISYKSLFALRANQLRNKYDKLILAYSGGTDSVTIVKAFLDNNIHIDMIYICYNKVSDKKDNIYIETSKQPERTLNWIKKTWPEQSKHIEFKIFNISDDQLLNEKYRKGWNIGLDPIPESLRFNNTLIISPMVHKHINDNYKNYAIITGHEKPMVVNKKACYLDRVFTNIINRPNSEMFFLSNDLPELAVKQAHDTLKYQSLGVNDYYLHKQMIGCEMDLYRQSKAEKDLVNDYEKEFKYVPFTDRRKTTEILLNSNNDYLHFGLKFYMQNDHKFAKTWLDGMIELETDKTLKDYMIRHGYLDNESHNVTSYNGIYSQSFLLSSIS